jgi:hypothetical protein
MRHAPDNITEELIAVLSSKASFEFKSLCEIMLLNLRERNAASGGEEMLRLRAYEKLQGPSTRARSTGKSQGPRRNIKALPHEWPCCALT